MLVLNPFIEVGDAQWLKEAHVADLVGLVVAGGMLGFFLLQDPLIVVYRRLHIAKSLKVPIMLADFSYFPRSERIAQILSLVEAIAVTMGL